MLKVQQENVDEIHNQHNLRPEVVMVHKQQRPDENTQVECRKVPCHQLGSLQPVSEPTGIVNSRDKDLSDKQNLQNKENGPVHQCHNDVSTEGSISDMVWVVAVKWVNTSEIPDTGICSKKPRHNGRNLVREKLVVRVGHDCWIKNPPSGVAPPYITQMVSATRLIDCSRKCDPGLQKSTQPSRRRLPTARGDRRVVKRESWILNTESGDFGCDGHLVFVYGRQKCGGG